MEIFILKCILDIRNITFEEVYRKHLNTKPDLGLLSSRLQLSALAFGK